MFANSKGRFRLGLATLIAGCACSVLASAQSTGALHTGHSIPGFYGFESSARPPLGVSYENTTVLYNASLETDRGGHDAGTSGNVKHISNHSTVTWMAPWRILGANYSARFQVSLANSAPHPRSLTSGNGGFDIGDTYLEPLALYWLGKRGYVSLRYGLWLDTGDFDASNLNSQGKGFLTHQGSLGFTYYPDEQKLWNLSVFGRFGKHSKVDGLDLRPGDDLVIDWAAGRKFGEGWNAGLVGYGVFQTSRDQGADSNKAVGYYGNSAIGVGAVYDLPAIHGSAKVRLYQEFNSFNHTQGQTAVVGVAFRI